VVYLDEMHIPTANGNKRAVVFNAGSEQGFIQNAFFVLRYQQSRADAREEVEFEAYCQWLTNRLVPHLPAKCAIVFDSSPLHDTEEDPVPSMCTAKAEMQSWLIRHGIEHGQDMIKLELHDLVKAHKPVGKTYRIDKLLAVWDHAVLRIPGNHPDLNPMKKVWDQVKGHIEDNNESFVLDDVIGLAEEKLNCIRPCQWEALCEQVKEEEEIYLENEALIDNVMQCGAIECSDDEDDDDSGDDDEDDDLSNDDDDEDADSL